MQVLIAPYTPQEVRRWAHRRRPHEREAPPEISERLLFRGREHGPTVAAIVFDVQGMTAPAEHWVQHGGRIDELGPGTPDPTVWVHDPATGWRLHDDPWPWVQLQVILRQDDEGSDVLADPQWCKEARVRGSAGWLREGSRAHTGNYEEDGR